MFYLLEIRLRPLIGGIVSLIPGVFSLWDRLRPMGDPRPPEFGRNVWRERLQDIRKSGLHLNPETVLELGPGRNLAALISALLDGAKLAIGVDAVHYANRQENLRVFDYLAAEINIDEDCKKVLRQSVTDAGRTGQENQLRYCAPWSDPSVVPTESIDFIFSISVLEHINDPDAIYQACYSWLRPGGVMAHKIDLSSHGITRHWNGHYWVPHWLWLLIVGRRTYSINRLLPDEHLLIAQQAGFQVISVENVSVEKNALSASQHQPARRFRAWPGQSLEIRTSVLVLQKPETPS